MKQIHNDFNESAYTFKTKDGLEVIVIHKPGFIRSVAAIGTPFGSINLKQKYNGKIYEHKKGIAHFLEHKLFDDEGEDVLEKFTALGANANAYTSFEQTVYYFNTNLSIYEPLKLLLEFVNRFDITEESVEKEKGIIIEELKMYDKMPDMTLLMKSYESIYHNFPMRYDIGGTIESVSETTLEDLKLAYKLNYNFDKMTLVIISGEEPENLKEFINTIDLNNESIEVEDVFDEEPLEVYREYHEIDFPVINKKMSLAYKFKYEGENHLYDEFLIRLILTMNFSELNDEYQDWLDQGLINEYFSYDVDLRDGFGVILFFNETEDENEFMKFMNEKINLLKIDEVWYNQIVKRYFGETILSLSQYDRYVLNYLTTHFKSIDYYEYLKMIRDINYEDLLLISKDIKTLSLSFNILNSF